MTASTDRVALVTGGSRGIGRAIVEALLAEDWRVFFCSLRPQSVAIALEGLCAQFPGRVDGWACDLGAQDQVEELVGRVTETGEGLDCLVNNAGVGLFAPIDEIPGEAWRRLLRTNLDGPFYATRAVVPIMKARGRGWIVNIASLAGRHAIAGGSAYNASKFGLMGLTEAAMLDLRQFGIRVTAILPGSVRTDFSRPAPRTRDDWKLDPRDVARVVVDLLHHPDRSLPSVVEIRPSRPPSK